MNFLEVLAKHGLTVETVSAGLKAKIKRYDKIAAAIAEAKLALAEAKTERKQKELGAEITRGEENLAALNDEISAGIERSVVNAEANEKRKKQLEEIRERKKANAGKADAGDAGEPAASDDDTKTDPPVSTADPVVDEPKKKSNAVAVVFGVLAAVGLGFLGIKYMNRE